MQRMRDYDQVDRKRIDSTRFRRCNPVADLCMGLGIFDLSRARVGCEDATEVRTNSIAAWPLPVAQSHARSREAKWTRGTEKVPADTADEIWRSQRRVRENDFELH